MAAQPFRRLVTFRPVKIDKFSCSTCADCHNSEDRWSCLLWDAAFSMSFNRWNGPSVIQKHSQNVSSHVCGKRLTLQRESAISHSVPVWSLSLSGTIELLSSLTFNDACTSLCHSSPGELVCWTAATEYQLQDRRVLGGCLLYPQSNIVWNVGVLIAEDMTIASRSSCHLPKLVIQPIVRCATRAVEQKNRTMR